MSSSPSSERLGVSRPHPCPTPPPLVAIIHIPYDALTSHTNIPRIIIFICFQPSFPFNSTSFSFSVHFHNGSLCFSFLSPHHMTKQQTISIWQFFIFSRLFHYIDAAPALPLTSYSFLILSSLVVIPLIKALSLMVVQEILGKIYFHFMLPTSSITRHRWLSLRLSS